MSNSKQVSRSADVRREDTKGTEKTYKGAVLLVNLKMITLL